MMSEIQIAKSGFGLLALLLVAMLYPVAVSGVVTWGTPTPLIIGPTSQDSNLFPQVFQAANGTVWLIWEWVNPLSTPTILYRTFNGASWSSGVRLTGDFHQNTHPTMAQLPNGTLIFVWATDRLGSRDLYFKTYNSGWSREYPLVTAAEQDEYPNAMRARDGSIWVVWHRRFAGSVNLYYKTLNGGQWSPDTPLTTGSEVDQYPAATQTKDGRIWVVWTRTRINQQIWYKVYDGVSWGPDLQLVSSSTDDSYPSIIQDRDGTLWVFFNRLLKLPGNVLEDALFYLTSADNGATWLSPVQLTGGPVNDPYDDDAPSVAQMRDKTLWLVWMSTRPPGFSFNIWLMTSSQIITHDVTVASISASPVRIRRGETTTITVISSNLGDFVESFTLQLQGNSTLIGLQTITLNPGQSTTSAFNWATYSSLSLGKYYLAATASAVTGETLGNVGDNTLRKGTVCLVAPGDVDRNGAVDIFDAVRVSRAYDSRPGDPNWNPDADINKNGIVDIIDAATVGRWYDTRVNC